MPVSISGQVAVIVGASSGIGRAAAVLFAREGAKVVAAARREDRLQSLKDELAKEHLTITVRRADASNPDDMQQLAQETLKQFGKIDILVVASGINTPDRSMKRLTPEIWNSLVNVNLDGAFYATHAILPSMRDAGAGHLIYISSISGVQADVSGAAYQASKRGVVGSGPRDSHGREAKRDKNVCDLPRSGQYRVIGEKAGQAVTRGIGKGVAGRRCC